ncbi:MAG: hypothetical protein PF545_01680 [Elusimicrobia bacterium]|nr:hypothetical protein [Elusimicrobiota bacterium]
MFLILYLLPSGYCVYGPGEADGGLPGEYLSYFTSAARAQGMGNAYTSAGNNSSSIYFNPAAIAGAGFHNIEALYTPLPMDGSFSAFFYSASLNLKTAAGIGIVALQSGDAVKRNIWGEQVDKFSSSKKALYMTGAYSFGEKFGGNINTGLNLKVVRESIDNREDSGLGIDAGIKYIPSEKLSMGFALQNILSPELKLKNTAESFPLKFTGGICYDYRPYGLLLSLDAGFYDLGNSSMLRWAAGAEKTLFKYLKLRGGINYKELTAGIGLQTKDFGFSYAARYSSLGLFSAVSTSYRFGMLPTAREREVKRRERIIEQKESRFDDWKVERHKVFLKNLDEKYKLLEAEQETVQKRRKELDALVDAALSVRGGDFEKAEKQLIDILSASPDNKDANTLLSIVQEELQKDFSFNRMISAYNSGNYEIALAESEKADISHPQYENARVVGLLTSARLNILEKNYSKARQNLNKLLDFRPDNSAAKTLMKKLERLKEIEK